MKIGILMASIIYCFSCFGQQVVDLNNSVNIDLPDGAKKINNEQALSFVNKVFNNNKTVLNSISQRDSKNIYKVDNILVSFFTDNHSTNEGHLLEIKKGFDGLYKGDSTYTSTIKKINNNAILIIANSVNNLERCDFFCFNNSNTKAITGVLEYNKIDANEASVVLNDIINSIKFKK